MLGRSQILLSLAVLVVLLGCSDPFREAARRDTAEAWRAYLASEGGSSAQRQHALERRETLAWEEARSLDRTASYRRYLELYPNGRYSTQAAARLDELRYERAREADSVFALEEYLARHADGARSASARERLVALRMQEALEAGTEEAYAAFLHQFPKEPATADVEAALEDSRLASVMEAGTLDALRRHESRHPEGAHREDVRLMARKLRVRARVLAGDDDGAWRLVAEAGYEPVRAALAEVACKESSSVFETLLDVSGLERLAADPRCAVVAGAARDSLRRVASVEGREELALHARALGAYEAGLPEAVIEAWLLDRDARRRRVAVRALGHSGDPDALELLSRALVDRNIGVRREASEALRRLGSAMPPVVTDVFFTELLSRMDGRAADPERIWVVAVLLEAAGHDERALEAHRRAAEAPDRVLARLRLAALERDDRRAAVALTGAALALRDALRVRVDSLDALLDERSGVASRMDPHLLRQTHALVSLLTDAVESAEARPDAELRFTWIEEARDVLTRAEHALVQGSARAALEDDSWIPHDFDEGAAVRAEAAARRARAAEAIAAADFDLGAQILARASIGEVEDGGDENGTGGDE